MEQFMNRAMLQKPVCTSAVMMQQSLNKLTGQVEWIVVRQDDHDDGEGRDDEFSSSAEEVSEALTMTTYLDMLNDTSRNRAYNLAIQKAVKGARHVLDIGAGTGLLSMMAWRFMCEEGRSKEEMGSITTCESFLPMFKLARKLLRANKVGAGVRLIHKRSDEMEVGIDMHCRADVLISEILDSELLGEGLIPSLRHAHQNLLTPNARCVPYRATIYAQLVECEHLWKCHDLPGVESLLADGVLLAPSDYNQFRGRSTAMHVDPLVNEIQLLSEPFEVFTFELSKAPDESRQRQHSLIITNSGRAHALVSWWVLQLDTEGEIFYSTNPKWIKIASTNGEADIDSQTEWCEHWKQVVWFLPRKGLSVSSGEEVFVTACHDAVSVSYDVVNNLGSGTEKDVIPKYVINCPELFEASMTPDRIGVLGHEPWRRVVRSAAETALRYPKTSLCVVLDDSLLMTMVAASMNASVQVVALFPGRALCQEYVDDISTKMGQNVSDIKVMNIKATSLTLEDLGGRKIDVLMAEPYYTACGRMLPWRLLRFWYERTQLTSLLSENTRLVPCRASLRGVAVYMPDLWKSRRFIKSVEGFDHSPVNSAIGACGELPLPHEVPVLPYAVWQCGRYEELTDVFTVMEFDFSHPIQTMEGVTEAAVRRAGLCHGIVLWMDWSLDPDGSLLLSSGPAGGRPTYWKQGVRLLRSPVVVDIDGAQHKSHPTTCATPNDLLVNKFVKVAGLFDSCNGDLKMVGQITSNAKNLGCDTTGSCQHGEASIDDLGVWQPLGIDEASATFGIHQIFCRRDKNGDGSLDMEELKLCLQELQVEYSDQEIEEFHHESDMDSSHGIQFKEFIVVLALIYLLGRPTHTGVESAIGLPDLEATFDEIAEAFVFFDRNKDGYVSKKEMIWAINEASPSGRHGHRIGVQRFEEMDWDKDGMITFKEFLFAFTDWVGLENDEEESGHNNGS